MRYYNNVSGNTRSLSYDAGLRKYMVKVYNQMVVALAISGITAFFTASNTVLMNAIFQTPLKFVVMFAPLVMVLIMGGKLTSMKPQNARLFFFGFAFLMGLSLASIFHIYTGTSIAKVFFITATTFGLMSMYGYTTQTDLSKFGNILFMALVGLIIAGLVNMFLQSSALGFATSAIGVLVFTGFIAYDTQNIKMVYYQAYYHSNASDRDLDSYSVVGALSLYISFVNLMMSLLHLLGDSRD